jgi:mannose-1-phosphate guanylyltransferase
MIPALVMTAGTATRLRPLSFVRAKPALPVAGDPLVCRILRWLAASGVTDVVANLHYRPDTITSILGDGSALGLRLRYSWEQPILGSAGGPRRAMTLLESDTMLIVNGDTLTDLDPQAVVAAHRSTGALITMAVVPNVEPDKYNGVLVDEDGVVTGFCPRGSAQPSYHFFGVQAIESRAIAHLSPDVPSESVKAVYPALIAGQPGSIRAYRCTAEYLDIGTPADYLATSLVIASRDGGSLTGRAVTIDPAARVDRSILWDDVTVEAGAMLRECVVTDGVTVPADTSWHGVSIRNAEGELAPGERRIDGLAIANI